MKTLIAIFIIVSFLQSTILPIDLVLIILICRSYIRSDQENLYLAFAFGLLDSHLNLNPLGIRSIVYLAVVQITQVLSKGRLASNPFLIIPISLILLAGNHIITDGLISPGVLFEVLPESILSLPVFYMVRLWEERFIVRKEIKLKV